MKNTHFITKFTTNITKNITTFVKKHIKNYNQMLITYIRLLPIVFIGRFTFELTIHNSSISINYLYYLLAITLLVLLIFHFKQFVKQLFVFIRTHKTLTWLIIFLALVDLTTTLISLQKNLNFAIVAYIKRLAVYVLFIFSSFAFSQLSKQHKKQAINLLIKTWNILFIINIGLSIWQLFDCYFFNCNNIIYIQQFFTSSALTPFSQMFGYWSPAHPIKLKILRPPGIFGDTNYNGMFLVLSAILYYILFLHTKNKKEQIQNMVKINISLFILVLTFSRSALLGILVYVPFLLYLFSKHLKKTLTLIFTTLTGLALFLLTLYFIFPPSIGFIIRRLNIKQDPSSLTHEKLFNESQTIIQKFNPKILGNGLDSYNTLYNQVIHKTTKKVNPHSVFIQNYIEQGVLGITSIILLNTYILITTYAGFYAYLTNTKTNQQKQLFLQLVVFLNLIIPYFLLVGTVYYGFYMPFVWAWGFQKIQKSQ